MKLENDQYEIFAQAYVANRFNGLRAAKQAYPNMSDKSAGTEAWRMLNKPDVQSRISELIAEVFDSMNVEVAQVVRKLWDVVNADPNELVEMRRDCCRYCYGVDNKYQYTVGEWDDIMEQYHDRLEDAEAERRRLPREPSPKGGVGFNRQYPPVGDCPECNGEGVERVLFKDSRNLSPAAKELYAGAKVTRNGIEILTHQRDKNLEMLGRYLAMFTDNTNLRSPDGSMTPKGLTDFYADLNQSQQEDQKDE